MAEQLSCYRCGASLEKLSLPLSRRDECPECTVHVHVCKMCVYFDANVPRQCREDDAEEVNDKEKVNFCEWFKPDSNAFDPARAAQADKAKSELESLFGDGPGADSADDPLMNPAEDLFK
jgi:hypothetical protein